jgi:amino acid transporter
VRPTPASASPAGDEPYGGEVTLVASLATLVAPFIALIAALVMRANELRPRRRSFLRGWAIASAAWLCTGWIVAFLVITSISSSASGCKGGIDRFSVPSFQSSDNVHWTATYACVNGGTKTVPFHGKVP